MLDHSYVNRITKDSLQGISRQEIGPLENLISTIMKRMLKWHGYVTQGGDNLSTTILHDTTLEKDRGLLLREQESPSQRHATKTYRGGGEELTCTATLQHGNDDNDNDDDFHYNYFLMVFTN